MLDTDIVIKARREGRIILTQDLDFPRIIALNRYALPSCIIIFRLGNIFAEAINRKLDEIVEMFQEELLQGVILSVLPTKIRIRKLPI